MESQGHLVPDRFGTRQPGQDDCILVSRTGTHRA